MSLESAGRSRFVEHAKGLWVPESAHRALLVEDESLWRLEAPLKDQLLSNQGEGFLMWVTDPQLLIARLKYVTPGRELVHHAIPFLIETFRGQPIRRDGKPPTTHPLRVTLRDAQENPDVTDIELVIDLLHDNAEDCGTTRADIIRHFRDKFGIACAEQIWFGISALNNREGGKKMKPRRYHRQIIHATTTDFGKPLHIADRKTGDRADNFLTDLRFALDHPDDKQAKRRIGHYLPKTIVASDLGHRFEPESRNTQRITEALTLARQIVQNGSFSVR